MERPNDVGVAGRLSRWLEIPALKESIENLRHSLDASVAESRQAAHEHRAQLERLEAGFADLADRLAGLADLPDRLANLAGLADRLANLAGPANRLEAVADRLETLSLPLDDILAVLLRPISERPAALLEAGRTLAIDSADHLFPRGTKNDNTRHPRFVRACEQVFGRKVRALDLGCAGGGLVLDFLLAGHFAIGLEGSDYSLRAQRACWRLIPSHLLVCDVTRPFRLLDPAGRRPMTFDVISAWELLEHIHERDLAQFFGNVQAHLAADGIFVTSIATFEDRDPESGVVWHVTVNGREWWRDQFSRAGFAWVEGLFEPLDLPRGSGNGPNDWSVLTNPEMGFHAVARRATAGVRE